MKLDLSVFWLPYSDLQSKPITNLLTNVLIVFVKYKMIINMREKTYEERLKLLGLWTLEDLLLLVILYCPLVHGSDM